MRLTTSFYSNYLTTTATDHIRAVRYAHSHKRTSVVKGRHVVKYYYIMCIAIQHCIVTQLLTLFSVRFQVNTSAKLSIELYFKLRENAFNVLSFYLQCVHLLLEGGLGRLKHLLSLVSIKVEEHLTNMVAVLAAERHRPVKLTSDEKRMTTSKPHEYYSNVRSHHSAILLLWPIGLYTGLGRGGV